MDWDILHNCAHFYPEIAEYILRIKFILVKYFTIIIEHDTTWLTRKQKSISRCWFLGRLFWFLTCQHHSEAHLSTKIYIFQLKQGYNKNGGASGRKKGDRIREKSPTRNATLNTLTSSLFPLPQLCLSLHIHQSISSHHFANLAHTHTHTFTTRRPKSTQNETWKPVFSHSWIKCEEDEKSCYCTSSSFYQ